MAVLSGFVLSRYEETPESDILDLPERYTLIFCAPEVIEEGEISYTKKADVYSFACMAYTVRALVDS